MGCKCTWKDFQISNRTLPQSIILISWWQTQFLMYTKKKKSRSQMLLLEQVIRSILIPISCGPQLISGLCLLPCAITLEKASGISSCFKIFFLALPNRSETQNQLWHSSLIHFTSSCSERCEQNLVNFPRTRNKSAKNIPLPFSDLKISGSSLWISSKCFVKWLGVLKSVMHMGHINPSKTSPLPAIVRSR